MLWSCASFGFPFLLVEAFIVHPERIPIEEDAKFLVQFIQSKSEVTNDLTDSHNTHSRLNVLALRLLMFYTHHKQFPSDYTHLIRHNG